MSEHISDPLNDFLNAKEPENDLFADVPFPVSEETDEKESTYRKIPFAGNSEFEGTEPDGPGTSLHAEQPKQTSLFEAALAQTPAAQQQQAEPPQKELSQKTSAQEEKDPFAAALEKAKAPSQERLAESFAEKDAVFSYGKAKDPITDRDCTFEDLRTKYETDFPELSESKKVSWSVAYGKVTKTILNPGSDKVYDIKAEIEKSKAFLDGINKAKTDAENQR